MLLIIFKSVQNRKTDFLINGLLLQSDGHSWLNTTHQLQNMAPYNLFGKFSRGFKKIQISCDLLE